MALDSVSPAAIAADLAARARARRLEANLTQQGLATRAGISLGSLKRFERTGAVSLQGLIRIAVALGLGEGFAAVLAAKELRTLDEMLATPPRRVRGRRR
ncbi:MAG: helix-turn-helix transcriptional regulator [Deltaproteobacteria bacterium]|nr:helix-turn-helix transcriptional regulator [Deltaproteobacteria bacterium]